MAEINHRVGIAGSIEDIYSALSTDEGLSRWWTTDTTGAGEEGSIIQFRFGGGGPDFQVAELQKNKLVRWKHSGSMPEDWMGTEISFELSQNDNEVVVRFRHSNWKQATDFLAHCSTKWARFLMSLKDAIETGKGQPYPDDVHIDHGES